MCLSTNYLRMKKYIITSFVCLFVLISIVSCTKETIETKEIDFSKKYFLSQDTSSGVLLVNFSIEFPTNFSNHTILDSIRATIITNMFGKKYVAYSPDSAVYLFAEMLKKEYIENNLDLVNELDNNSPYSFNNEHTLSGFPLMSDKKIFSYGTERYVYMGGAHGLETRNYYNFDLKTGKLIAEKDLFTDNYTLALASLIKKQILANSENIKNSESIKSLDDTDFFPDSIKPNNNFYITDESINYVFNPYEIGPYYLGETEVILPFGSIKNLLKPNNPIDYLVNEIEKK